MISIDVYIEDESDPEIFFGGHIGLSVADVCPKDTEKLTKHFWGKKGEEKRTK